jgi:hypothetical protein
MLTEHCFNTGSVTLNYAEGASSGLSLVLLHVLTEKCGGMIRLLRDSVSLIEVIASRDEFSTGHLTEILLVCLTSHQPSDRVLL